MRRCLVKGSVLRSVARESVKEEREGYFGVHWSKRSKRSVPGVLTHFHKRSGKRETLRLKVPKPRNVAFYSLCNVTTLRKVRLCGSL